MSGWSRSRHASLLDRAAAAVAIALLVAACSGSAAPSRPAPSASPSPALTADPILYQLTAEGLRAHLVALDAIADQNGGNRAVGSPGFDASVTYAENALTGFGYHVERQEFEVPVFTDPGGNELAIVGGRSFRDGTDFMTFMYSVAATIEGRLVVVAGPCSATGFDGVTPHSVVLVQVTPNCEFDIRKPVDGGAAAVVLSAPWPDGKVSRPMAPEGYIAIPAIATTEEAGAALAAAAGSTVRVKTTGRTDHVATVNLLAELVGSDQDRVVMFGAHLDSVPDGPGVDDDATGVAAVLEVARVLAETHPAATVRFALWSSEELGMLGSQHYVQTLSAAETRRVEAYLNADMIGAKNGIRAFYAGSANLRWAITVGQLLTEYFVSRGLKVEATQEATGRTDAQAFSDAGIAAVGLVTAQNDVKSAAQAQTYGGTAGAETDACYHLACDDSENVDMALLREMTAAYASAITKAASGAAPTGE